MSRRQTRLRGSRHDLYEQLGPAENGLLAYAEYSRTCNFVETCPGSTYITVQKFCTNPIKKSLGCYFYTCNQRRISDLGGGVSLDTH